MSTQTTSIATDERSAELRPAATPQTVVPPLFDRRYSNLAGIKVCHLSPLQRRDPRAYYRESVLSAAYGIRASIIGPHGEQESAGKVELIPIRNIKNRGLRILFSVRSVFRAARQQADIYHAHNPEEILPALILKLFLRKRVVYDSREDFPAMMANKIYLSPRMRKFAAKFVLAAERLAAQCLDGFITADSGSLRPYAKTGKSCKLVFYNFPNLSDYPELPQREKKFELVYRGGLSERAGTFDLLDAIGLLRADGIAARTLLFGYTDDEHAQQKLRDYMEKLGIADLITLRGVIPQSAMPATLSQAHISVCPLRKIPKFLNNIPVKVFESWACSMPVIATDLKPIRPFFEHRDRDLLVPPEDPQSLANAIAKLLRQPAKMAEIGVRARRSIVQRYNNGIEIRKLLSLYQRVLAG
jgi:glycosyltransferase involved in cell wall biosynthesis